MLRSFYSRIFSPLRKGLGLVRLLSKIALTLVIATWAGFAVGADEAPTAAQAPVADIPVSGCAQQLLQKDTVIPAGMTECRAYIAVYLDQFGRFMYLENVYNDPRRLIQTIPVHEKPSGGCIGGPACFVCLGLRCGCVC